MLSFEASATSSIMRLKAYNCEGQTPPLGFLWAQSDLSQDLQRLSKIKSAVLHFG